MWKSQINVYRLGIYGAWLLSPESCDFAFSLFFLFCFNFNSLLFARQRAKNLVSLLSFICLFHSFVYSFASHSFVCVCSDLAWFDCSEFCVDLVIKHTSICLFVFCSLLLLFSLLNSGEFHTGYTRNELQGVSWYHLLHWESMREAQNKHRLSECHFITRTCQIISNEQKQRMNRRFVKRYANIHAWNNLHW